MQRNSGKSLVRNCAEDVHGGCLLSQEAGRQPDVDETTNANEVGSAGFITRVGRAVVDVGGSCTGQLLAMQIALTVSRLKLDSCQKSSSRRSRRLRPAGSSADTRAGPARYLHLYSTTGRRCGPTSERLGMSTTTTDSQRRIRP